MQISRITWENSEGEHMTLLRDARYTGDFIRGVECNEQGIGTREGCTEDAEFMIHVSRLKRVVVVVG